MKKKSFARLRRVLAMIAALTILLAGLTACSKKDADAEDTAPDTEATTPVTETTAPVETTEAPEETEPEVPAITGIVNTNNLNVRTSPSSTSAILGQLDAGDSVEILEQQTVDGFNWGRIYEGWIRLDFVTIAGQEPEVEEETTTPAESTTTEVSGTPTNKSGTVNAKELNIRKGPDTSYESVGKYTKGDKVTITETKGDWGKTDKGWVSMKYITVSETTSSNSSNTTSGEVVSNGSTNALGTVTITHEALNVRTGPGNTYDVVKFVTKGKSFSYYQTSGDWVRINDGWIYTKGYTDLGGGTVSGTATNITGTVNATELNIRKGPDISYESVGKYYNGDQVTITETLDGWGKTDKGWVSMKYIKSN